VTDTELAMGALQRALAENLRVNPHAPIHLGRSTEFAGQSVQALLMMRPCRCGAHLSQALFMGSTPAAAIREATRWVAAMVREESE
jgi:hypothetical protein